ncbi:hypothetical protein BO83DRAFT_3314 [Aspergillus eucalypticola CBS 122712]|uniref:Uncharacterized protein n=1 Tax=Aspergillus eucalypticola (strain CBS 122712 / IBT 29274) TaxID=1448314 RepID=A0A317WIZ5_ASPEC|nr:uncharacterized protein BO83DRAFT_3314 [Aspergillus eucalypticola CBS 122712]PWY85252.1 hypothetical protein BO83DRAFT_3314 [Aspergillus eucalypticola CBS 122712]
MGNPTGFILPNGFLVMSAIERSPKKRASKQPIVENRQKESRKKKEKRKKENTKVKMKKRKNKGSAKGRTIRTMEQPFLFSPPFPPPFSLKMCHYDLPGLDLGVQLTSGFLGYPNRDVLFGDMASPSQPDSPHSRRIPSHTQ